MKAANTLRSPRGFTQRLCCVLAVAGAAMACGGASGTIEPPSQPARSATAASEASAPPAPASESAGAGRTSTTDADAAAHDWREHEVVGFGGRLRAKVFASAKPVLEREPAPDAEGSERASLTIPIGEGRPIDCDLRSARLSAVELVTSITKLVAKHRTTATQASVSHVDQRLVLRYALEVDDTNDGARVGTIRVAMAIGESDTAFCSHLGGDHGATFEAATAAVFRGLGDLSAQPAGHVDVVWVHSSTPGGSPRDVEHRLRARSPAVGGPAEELGVSLTASIDKGELLVSETVFGARLDAASEVTEATIATLDSRGNAVDVGVVRRTPKLGGAGGASNDYVLRVVVGANDQMSPARTNTPLTTELSMAPKIAALRRARRAGKAELLWTELAPVGLDREVSVVQTRRLVAVQGGVDLFVDGSDPTRWSCTADDLGAPLLCQLRAPDGALLTRSRVFARR
jgi:hypothetical protein